MADKLEACFEIGARVEKKSGSSWRGIIVGSYSTALTPVGWAVESETEIGSVQIYPEKALRLIERTPTPEQAGEVERVMARAIRVRHANEVTLTFPDADDAVIAFKALQSTPPAQPTADAVEVRRQKYAAQVEGDSDNPLRVAEANAILRGERDDLLTTLPTMSGASNKQTTVTQSGSSPSNPQETAVSEPQLVAADAVERAAIERCIAIVEGFDFGPERDARDNARNSICRIIAKRLREVSMSGDYVMVPSERMRKFRDSIYSAMRSQQEDVKVNGKVHPGLLEPMAEILERRLADLDAMIAASPTGGE